MTACPCMVPSWLALTLTWTLRLIDLLFKSRLSSPIRGVWKYGSCVSEIVFQCVHFFHAGHIDVWRHECQQHHCVDGNWRSQMRYAVYDCYGWDTFGQNATVLAEKMRASIFFFFAVVSDLRGEVGLMATIVNSNGANEACKNLALQYAGERGNEHRQRVSLF